MAATDDDDQLANFSNYGGTSVDLGAPGVYTYSTVPNGYKYFSGTSMATSHVAGVAALLKSQNPLYSDEQMKDQILRYAEPKNRLQSKTATGGRLNAAAALTGQPTPDETRPTVTAPRPVPGSTIRDRTPLIGATVRDDRTELSEANIKLYLDGKQRGTFNYDANTDRLSYEAPQLSYARHMARVSVKDAAGNVGGRSWSFKVERRR